MTDQLPSVIVCPRCGNTNPFAGNHCLKCGLALAPVREAVLKQASTSPVSTASSFRTVCHQCGAPVDRRDLRCPYCSANLQEPQPAPVPSIGMATPPEEPAPAVEDEKEPFHWMMAIATVICAVIGFAALGSESGGGILFGLAAVGFAIAGAVVTEAWTKVDRLPLGPKVIAWIPAIVGGSVVVIIMLILGIGGEAAKSTGRDISRASSRAYLRSDIERAVRQANRKK